MLSDNITKDRHQFLVVTESFILIRVFVLQHGRKNLFLLGNIKELQLLVLLHQRIVLIDVRHSVCTVLLISNENYKGVVFTRRGINCVCGS